MNRRNFVLLGASGIAAISIPTACTYFGDVEYDPLLAHPQALSLIWDNELIKTIGNKYRSQVPDEKNVRSLVNFLMEDISGNKPLHAEPLEQKIKTDFKTGKTVLVNGWVLSVSEARQCALYSLTKTK